MFLERKGRWAIGGRGSSADDGKVSSCSLGGTVERVSPHLVPGACPVMSRDVLCCLLPGVGSACTLPANSEQESPCLEAFMRFARLICAALSMVVLCGALAAAATPSVTLTPNI